MADGWPMLGTCHHPITVDRTLDLAHASGLFEQMSKRRWYGFLGMQKRVARRMPRILTVSESSKRDIVDQMGVAEEVLKVVPIGADPDHFRPRPEVARVPGRIMTTASSDVPLKGLVPLLEAVAKLRTERTDAHLVVVGALREGSPVRAVLERLGIADAVTFASRVSDDRLVELYGEAEVAVVPSLYEGFSLPAIEAMACGVPVVATTGGALPEVVGASGDTGLLVRPNDPGALTHAIDSVLTDRDLAGRLAEAGRRRVLHRFTWAACATATAEHYRWVIDRHRSGTAPPGRRRAAVRLHRVPPAVRQPAPC
jgi:glycosyltransferase involved in cell wall biosynthesis